MNKRQLWIRRLEQRSGIRPLDFKMDRYIERLQITSIEHLRLALIRKQLVPYVGEKAINKLKLLAGLELAPKKRSWKDEVKRLRSLLDKHGIEYK